MEGISISVFRLEIEYSHSQFFRRKSVGFVAYDGHIWYFIL